MGFIKVDRGFFYDDFWQEKREFSRAEAFLDMIFLARYSSDPGRKLIGGNVITWDKGSFPASVRFLQTRWGWSSTSRVKRFLDRLAVDGKIKITRKHGQNVVTLIGLDLEDDQNTKRTPPDQKSEHQSEQIEEHNENVETPTVTVSRVDIGTEIEQKENDDQNTKRTPPDQKSEQNSNTVSNKEEQKEGESNVKHPNGAQAPPSGENYLLPENLRAEYVELTKLVLKSNHLSKVPKKIGPERFEKLRDQWSGDQIIDTLTDLSNWKGVAKKTDLYLTLLNALKRNFGESDLKELIPALEERYRDFVVRETGNQARIDSSGRIALNKLARYLRDNNSFEDKKEGAIAAWDYILHPNNWRKLDAYTRKRIELKHIESDILSIYKQLKDASKKETKSSKGSNRKNFD